MSILRFVVLTTLLCGAVLALVGCSPDKPVPLPPAQITPPSARLMADCPDLPDVPRDEHKNDKARAGYYAKTREMYVDCRQGRRDLQTWARTATSAK